MKLKRRILDVILGVINCIVTLFPIKDNQIAFISLESNVLESDLLLLYNALKKEKQYHLVCVLTKFNKNTLWTNFLYMLNTIKQVFYINRSKLVIINDNNYVISRFKRKDVQVLQIWHATGAIKKFGNVIKREYPIANYDYVVANSDYWKEPYSEAFSVAIEQVKVLGMPRVDHLLQDSYIQETRIRLFSKYPMLQDKKIILYAPTFRGNIYQGFKAVDFPGLELVEALGKEYVLLYKHHPLLHELEIAKHPKIYDMFEEDTHDLFTISDYLISDFSSIIFDYSLLQKPMIFFVPDKEEYIEKLGCFVDYETMPGPICKTMEEVKEAILENNSEQVTSFRDCYFTYQDGNNTKRVVEFINEVMKKR